MTDTKLFHVDITYSVMVAARDEKEAETLVNRQLRLIADNEQPDIMCTGLVTKVGSDWAGCIPYGDANDQPCKYFTGEL
jgi:hypothetical protein